jgi:uncharacterized protein (DUF1501 family)
MRSSWFCPLTRRAWLQASSSSLLGLPLTGWLAGSAAQGAAISKPAKRCIVLWMDGGPSHLDTFDPKPDAPANIRGQFEAIDTSIAGVQFGEKFPKLAEQAHRLAVIRGMKTDEADHGRARIYMHTGYKPGQGGLNYPVLGSMVSAELGRDDYPLPNFVATGVPLGKYDFVTEPGFRGPRHAALVHYDPTAQLDYLEPAVPRDEFARREAALAVANASFAERYRAPAAEGHRAVVDRAVRLMRAEQAQAFDLSKEPASMRERYGQTPFGQGCLLARRLVEVGVPFVEVYQGNWDIHEKRVVEQCTELMPTVDQGMAALLVDLADRGLLDETLVIWMGEFGRTPQVNREGGRDHYSKAWCTLLAGGGIRGGQVIGRTDSRGGEVIDRAVSARDFMATVCQALGIDYQRELQTPIGRPVRIVDAGAEPIRELFG